VEYSKKSGGGVWAEECLCTPKHATELTNGRPEKSLALTSQAPVSNAFSPLHDLSTAETARGVLVLSAPRAENDAFALAPH
jgi:hypothetical protein